jgi:hypothetical protein
MFDSRLAAGNIWMQLRTEALAGGVTRAIPEGHWDIKGAAEIDVRLSAVTGSGRPIIWISRR